MSLPDSTSLRRAVSGDEEALAALLAEVGPGIRRSLQIARKWQSVVDPDDVMQVTYMEVFMRITRFTAADLPAFTSWVRRIAENNLRDAVRELGRAKRPDPARRVGAVTEASYVALLDQLSGATATPSRVVAGAELTQAVEAALQTLPADYARVIRLADLEGRSGPETASAMSRSHGAVRMLLARAREHLRDALGPPSRFFSTSS